MFSNYNRLDFLSMIGHHMFKTNTSHLHAVIDQQGIIGKTLCIYKNSNLILDQEKITIGITHRLSFVLSMNSLFMTK